MPLQKIKSPQITDSMISEIATKIVDNFHPEKIILFGSQVWGKSKDWSDIDILVIMNLKESPSLLTAKISIIAKPRFIPMDILVRTPDEIEKRIKIGDPFIRRILTNGRVIYERNAG